ncbi:MAG: Fe-S-containing hydro-lyase, partial [Oscillospiraceae bacterium]
MGTIRLTTPLTEEQTRGLKAGDNVLISGVIYTGRDAAHKRFVEALDKGEKLPFDPEGQVIYYVGPTPTKPGNVIGSCGPTSSYRMDPFAPRLLELGLKGMIGKGKRNDAVIESMKKNGGVYFGAVGGAAALISKSVTKCDIIAYEDLGPEAVRRLEIKDFPAIVIIDSEGTNLYNTQPI